MKKKPFERLSGRERQIMDVIYRRGEASVAEVLAAIPDPPSYSSVRALLGILKNKGLVRYEKRGRTYVYKSTMGREKVRHSALKHVLQTFFDGSVERVVTALIDHSSAPLNGEQLKRLEKMIRELLEKEKSK